MCMRSTPSIWGKRDYSRKKKGGLVGKGEKKSISNMDESGNFLVHETFGVRTKGPRRKKGKNHQQPRCRGPDPILSMSWKGR